MKIMHTSEYEESYLYGYHASDLSSVICPYGADVLEEFNTHPPRRESYGVELEYVVPVLGAEEQSDARRIFADAVDELDSKIRKFAILKEDRSLTPIGIEIVSLPMSIKQLKTKFKPMFDKHRFVFSDEFQVHNYTGMHVHVSAEWITPLHLYKLMSLMHHKELHEFFIEKARRECEHYAHLEYMSSTEAKDLVVKGLYRVRDRYVALNTRNPNTLEFRLFRTPVSYKEFCESLDLCEALVDFSRESSLGVVNHPHCFIDYFEKKEV